MFDDLRYRLGYRAALKAARDRSRGPARPLGTILIVLPTDEDNLRAAWRFIQTFDVRRTQLTPVVSADRVPYTPDAFAASVATVGEKEHDWRRLPHRTTAHRLWGDDLSLALDLTPDFDLTAAYLVGASPAAFRVGLWSEEGEPFYDLMIAPTSGYEAALRALRGYLGAVEPAVLTFTD